MEINIDGDCVYDVTVYATGTDGVVYKYVGRITIFAYDKDDDYAFIELDESDEAVPVPVPFIPTALENANATQHQNAKAIRNGQLIIIRDGVRYNALGQVVE